MIAKNSDFPADTEYKLYRGGRESIRLTAQHHCLVERQKGLLHPEIVKSIQRVPNPQIADVATGTGIWAVELAEKMTQADVYGLDISDQQFPPAWTCPANVYFGKLDLLQAVPEKYRNKFDVVHVRLLLAAGPAVDKEIFIDCFRTLLKPGGWLQWDDLIWPSLLTVTPSKDRSASWHLEGMQDHPSYKMMVKHLGLDKKIGWTHLFPEVMDMSGGFCNVQQFRPPPLPRLLKLETDVGLSALLDMLIMIAKSDRATSQADQLQLSDAMEAVQRDQDSGMLCTYNWTSNIAQKSMG